ncbi:hypothetical protein INT45_010429 [Circinella minor]|uniref:Uncharacterized protein n=1 Tax=Circinella minor TaxID=1195481 RepID=A0A8H7RQ13_9FUNG|nr:hypothetical protein INT45_010429 [Circinella minor]
MSPRIAKLVAKIAFLEEEMVRDDLSEEDLVKKKLAKKDKAVTTISSSVLIVPSDLPLLQWTGNVHDNTKTVFASIHECLDRFEDIIELYEPHAALDWSFTCKMLINKYGIQDADRQAQYMQELFLLHMGRDDLVELYTDWFHKLRPHLSPDKRATIDHAANLAHRMYGNVVHSKYSKQVTSSSDSSTSSTGPIATGPSFAVSGKKK